MKTVRKLKSAIRGILCFVGLGCSLLSLGQTVTIKGDSLSLQAVIASMQRQADVHFAYDPAFIQSQKVSVQVSDLPVAQALDIILKNTNVCFRESGHMHYLIFPCTDQKWEFIGVVRDKETGEVLPFADVSSSHDAMGVIANRDGQFAIHGLTGDSAKLTVYYIGYKPEEVLVSPRTTSFDISLERMSTALKRLELNLYTEVVNPGEYFGGISINSNMMEGLPTLGEPDPIKSVKLLPGVGGNAETSTGIAMRGGKFDQTMILFDDFQLLHVDHFFGLFSTINQNMVKNIQVYRSGYSSKYSGFTSGLVQIVGKDGNSKKVSGGVTSNVYSSSAYLEVPILKNKWSTALSFRRDNAWINQQAWSDGIVLPHIENEIRVKTPSSAESEDTEGDLNFNDVSFKTRLKVAKNHELILSMFRSTDKVVTNYNNSIDDEEEIISILDLSSAWSNDGVSLKWDHQLSKNFSAELIYTYSKFDNNTNFDHVLEVIDDDTLDNYGGLGFSNSFTQEHYRYDAEWKRRKSIWFFGADITRFKSRFTAMEEDEEFVDNFGKTLPAVYIENERKVTSKLKLLIGSRFTYEDEGEDILVEPRMSAFYRIGKYLKSSLSYGLYYQHAKQYVPDERDGLIPDYWLLPDYEQAFPTRAHIASLGLTYTRKRWMINGEVFHKDLRQMAEQFPSISDLFESNADFVKVLSSGNSTVNGADLIVRKRLKKISTWVGLGLNQVTNTSDSINEQDYQPYYTNFADVKLGFMYSWKKWEASLIWTWLGGRRFTNVDQSISQLSQAEIGNDALPDYHRLDASLSYKLSINKLNGAVRATVFNAYNRENIRTINFTYLDSSPDTRPEAIPVSTLGIRPNLTLEINF